MHMPASITALLVTNELTPMKNVLSCSFFLLTGIMAGAWPCGTITILGELFGAESKSQVYGMLHAYLHVNRESTSNLRKVLLCILPLFSWTSLHKVCIKFYDNILRHINTPSLY